MVDKESAKQLVFNQINKFASTLGELVVLDDCAIEKEFGWVFFWDSALHQQTNDFQHAYAGNAPIIVNRQDGSLHFTGTAYPTEHYIREYEDNLEREHQKWALIIHDDPKQSVQIQARIKKALGLSLQEVGDLKAKIPGIIATGARRDLLARYDALVLYGISADLKERTEIESRI